MKKRRRLKLLIPLCLLSALVIGSAYIYAAYLKGPKAIPSEKIASLERGDLARSVVATGKIEPLSKVEVKSKANGIIKTLLVNVGDPVRAGQVLVELDKENLQAHVREARAALEAEQANLQAIMAAEAKARVEALNPDLEFARREFQRNKTLFEQGVVSRQSLDDAEKVLEVAKNRHDLLQAAVRNASAQVEQARSRVAEKRAALDRAEEELQNATVRAPISGVVLTRDREVGDAVSSILNLGSAATLIMTLGDASTVYVKGKVDEADVGKISIGLPARIRVESLPSQTFAGTVTKIAPMGVEKDNVTTFEVRVSIDNPEGRLLVNMTANAEIVLEERKNALLIPEAAVIYDKDKNAFAQLLDPSMPAGFRQVPIKLGISNGQKTELVEGLKEGDRIVLP
jgi:HlyD family secretion protein